MGVNGWWPNGQASAAAEARRTGWLKKPAILRAEGGRLHAVLARARLMLVPYCAEPTLWVMSNVDKPRSAGACWIVFLADV